MPDIGFEASDVEISNARGGTASVRADIRQWEDEGDVLRSLEEDSVSEFAMGRLGLIDPTDEDEVRKAAYALGLFDEEDS